MGQGTGVSGWKNGGGEQGQLCGVCCNEKERSQGVVEGKNRPERAFNLFFPLILKGERYVYFPDEVKEVERQVLTRLKGVWRTLINCRREFLEREGKGCGERLSTWPPPELQEGDRKHGHRCRGMEGVQVPFSLFHLLREIRSKCIIDSTDMVEGDC